MFRRTYVSAALAAAMMTAGVSAAPPPADFLTTNRAAKGVVETPSGLQYKVLEPGEGDSPTDADVALLTYEGRLLDGTVFDKSETPTVMPIASVVPGFAEGLKMMRRGASYRVWIKPSLAYGEAATGPIPANSTLVFDIKLIDFMSEAALRKLAEEHAQAQEQPQIEAAPQPK